MWGWRSWERVDISRRKLESASAFQFSFFRIFTAYSLFHSMQRCTRLLVYLSSDCYCISDINETKTFSTDLDEIDVMPLTVSISK